MNCQSIKCCMDAVWAMQPFGPDKVVTFALIGNHYRGFPVIKVCDLCKENIEEAITGEMPPFFFNYKGRHYAIDQNGVRDVGEAMYYGDARRILYHKNKYGSQRW